MQKTIMICTCICCLRVISFVFIKKIRSKKPSQVRYGQSVRYA